MEIVRFVMGEACVHKVTLLLESEGLISEEKITRDILQGWSFKKVSDFSERLNASLDGENLFKSEPEQTLDIFSFTASASLRGDSGCAHWGCRSSKIESLGRFAALYSGKVVYPVRVHFHESDSQKNIRTAVAGAVLGLDVLRPAIDAGVIQPVKRDLCFCIDHWREAVPLFDDIRAKAGNLATENAGRFSLRYYPDDRGAGGALNVQGPPEFIEHGDLWRRFRSRPPWAPLSRHGRNPKDGIALSATQARESKVVEGLFRRMGHDAAIEQFYGLRYNSTYLTDLPGEGSLLESLDQDFVPPSVVELCHALEHSIPLLDELPMASVLRIREEDPEAFVRYRAAVNEIATDYIQQRRTLSASEIRDVINDKFKKELQMLQAAAKEQRNKRLLKIVGKLTWPAALIGLGVFGGILPTQAAQLCSAIGALGLAKEFGESAASLMGAPAEIRRHNFYFLLKLSNAAKRN